MNRYGDFRKIRPAEHGMFTLPHPTDVLVRWHGGQREVISGVTRAYVTNDGRLTLMNGNSTVGRLSLTTAQKKHRKGQIEQTFDSVGAVYSALLEVNGIF